MRSCLDTDIDPFVPFKLKYSPTCTILGKTGTITKDAEQMLKVFLY